MKYIFIISAILFSSIAHSQKEVDLRKTYIIGENVRLTFCDGAGIVISSLPTPDAALLPAVTPKRTAVFTRANILSAATGGTTVHTAIVYRGYEFKVVKKEDTFVVIQMLQWESDHDLNSVYYDPTNAPKGGPTVFFQLPLTEFEKSLDKNARMSFAVGVLTMPIKIRFGSKEDIPGKPKERYFNFEGSINAGLSAGLALRLNKSKFVNRDYLSFLAGISISSVPIDSFTTKGFIKTSTNTSSLTFNFTLLYQRDNFQAGIFAGTDHLAGETGRQWIYKDKLWMGIGMGFSIFQTKRSTDTVQ